MKQKSLVAIAAALFFACFAHAGVAADATVVPVFDTAKVVAEQDQIRADAKAGTGRYKNIRESDRLRLYREQDRLLSVLGDRSYEQLSRDERLAAFNSLEAISAIVNQEGDERMVCERVKTIGSNRVERVCMSVAQRERERERARQNMDRNSTMTR